MIHFIIGTKAQFIKMAPLMHVLGSEGIRYRVLDLGQHAGLTAAIVQDFGLKPEIVRIRDSRQNVESYFQALTWLMKCTAPLLRARSALREKYFGGVGGVAMIHGDTVSTLLGLYLARRAGLAVGLVEAGLTSGVLLDPFPEELIRRHAERHSNLLFAPGAAAEQRLRSLCVKGGIWNTGYNTGRDALALIISRHDLLRPPAGPGSYSVLTLHRLESISRRERLREIISHVLRLAADTGPIRFYLHGPTELALRRCGLLKSLQSHPGFRLAPLLPYPQFMREVIHCRYLLTDGGSIQEEAAYLRKPTLLLRRRTERTDGLADTVRLSTWDPVQDVQFLSSVEATVKTELPPTDLSASRLLLDVVCGIDGELSAQKAKAVDA